MENVIVSSLVSVWNSIPILVFKTVTNLLKYSYCNWQIISPRLTVLLVPPPPPRTRVRWRSWFLSRRARSRWGVGPAWLRASETMSNCMCICVCVVCVVCLLCMCECVRVCVWVVHVCREIRMQWVKFKATMRFMLLRVMPEVCCESVCSASAYNDRPGVAVALPAPSQWPCQTDAQLTKESKRVWWWDAHLAIDT